MMVRCPYCRADTVTDVAVAVDYTTREECLDCGGTGKYCAECAAAGLEPGECECPPDD